MLRRLDNLCRSGCPDLGASASTAFNPPSSLNSGGYSGSHGYNPVKSFCSLGLPVPISEAGAESIRVQRVPEDLIRCFFEMGQIQGVRIFCSRRPKRTAGPSLQAPAFGAGAI